MYRKALPLLLLILLLSGGCRGLTGLRQPTSPTLSIFAAASLSEAFSQIGSRFEEQHPGAQTVFNFAGSQQLAQQIVQGAPADVFASADQLQMEAVIRSSQVLSGTQRLFVSNRLVVIYPASNPAHIQSLQDLAKPGLKLVLAAREVPVGQYSLQFLDKAAASLGSNFRSEVLGNVVSYEENVRAVLSKVILGEADAGIVYTSDISQANAAQVRQIEIPANLNIMAAYSIAPLASSKQPDLARAFVDFVLSPPGQEILMNNGFTPAP